MSDPLDGGDPLQDPDLTQTSSATARPKELIGPYRLLRLVGEGGMGEVWLAEQTHPVHRQVALKVIKAGMDTAQVVARFEAERQALALMDHSAIARVFDAGATPHGRPYFVMEYVRGESITSHATRHTLSIRSRIELFMQVCAGVQHAHQKGIIHRDLKPSNILVTLQNDRPVPKIIDFGVAKAMTHSLTERTLHTEFGALVGTPKYMSPEQVDISGVDIDTRTDVYALGIVLYELLTGRVPFEAMSLREKSLEELRRIIREVDPPRPSTKVSTTADTVGRSAAGVDAVRLSSQLRGDLDWITMKALEKDRVRRYATVGELAADLQRHLDNQPVLASPPSTAYRVQKFVRRNRFAVMAAAALAVLLVAFGGTMAVQARRIAHERDRANREAAAAKHISSFMTNLFQISNPSEARGNSLTAREILDTGADRIRRELKEQPEVRATLMDTMGHVYNDLGLYAQAEGLLRESLEIRNRVLGSENPDVATSLDHLAKVLYRRNDFDGAEARYREALAMRRKLLGHEHPDVAETLNYLALVMDEKGDYDSAEALLRETLAIRRKLFGNEHPDVAMALNGLAGVLDDKGDYAAAEALNRDALGMLRTLFKQAHPAVSYTLNILGEISSHESKFAEAEKAFRESLENGRKVLPPDHIYISSALIGLGKALAAQGNALQASIALREGIDIEKKILPKDASDIAGAESALGGCLTRLRRFDEAEPLLLGSYQILVAKPNATTAARAARQHLIDLYDAWGKPEKAKEWRAVTAASS